MQRIDTATVAGRQVSRWRLERGDTLWGQLGEPWYEVLTHTANQEFGAAYAGPNDIDWDDPLPLCIALPRVRPGAVTRCRFVRSERRRPLATSRTWQVFQHKDAAFHHLVGGRYTELFVRDPGSGDVAVYGFFGAGAGAGVSFKQLKTALQVFGIAKSAYNAGDAALRGFVVRQVTLAALRRAGPVKWSTMETFRPVVPGWLRRALSASELVSPGGGRLLDMSARRLQAEPAAVRITDFAGEGFVVNGSVAPLGEVQLAAFDSDTVVASVLLARLGTLDLGLSGEADAGVWVLLGLYQATHPAETATLAPPQSETRVEPLGDGSLRIERWPHHVRPTPWFPHPLEGGRGPYLFP